MNIATLKCTEHDEEEDTSLIDLFKSSTCLIYLFQAWFSQGRRFVQQKICSRYSLYQSCQKNK